jgi:hypothetical protein
MILYILYFTVQEHAIFYWGKLISNEIYSQLSHYKKYRKFFMASYLIFSIVHCFQFPNLTISKRVNCEKNLIPFGIMHCGGIKPLCFSMKFIMILFQSSKIFLMGEKTPRIYVQATKFLEKKGTIEKMENHNIIRIFCSKENPYFLPYYVPEKLFITEVVRQYNLWLHFFHEKRKNSLFPCHGRFESLTSEI